MNDNEAIIKIIADASKVAPGVDVVKAQMAQLNGVVDAAVDGFRQGFNDQLKTIMEQSAGATQGLTGKLGEFGTETERESARLREMAAHVQESVEGFNKFKSTLVDVAEVWMAAFAVDRIIEWSKEVGEANEKIVHLSESFGLTTAEVQQFQAMAETSGLQVDTLTKGLAIMDKNLINSKGATSAQANAFKQLGISIDDGRTNMEKLIVIADHFSKMENGPKKAALAMEIFGKSGTALIPILNMGAAGIEEFNKRAEEYGAVNDRATTAGYALADAWDENHLAMIGLTKTLTEEFAPAMTTAVNAVNDLIKDFAQSYKEGGAAKQMLEGVGEAAKLLAVFFVDCGAIAVAFGEAINGTAWAIQAVIEPLFDIIAAAVKATIVSFQALGKIMADAFTLNWGAIEGDFRSGMNAIGQIALEGGRNAGNAFKQGFQNAAAAFAAGDAAMTAADKFANSMFGNGSKHDALPTPKNSKDFDPDLGATHNPKKMAETSRVSEWENELDRRKLTLDEENDAENTHRKMSDDEEAKYWQGILARNDLNSKEKLDVEKKFLTASLAAQDDAFQYKIAKYQEDLDAAKGNADLQVKIAGEMTAEFKRYYGESAKEYEVAKRRENQIARQAADEKVKIAIDEAKRIEQAKLAEIDQAQAQADFLVEMGLKTKGELLQQEREFENQRAAVALARLEHDRALIDPTRDPAKYQQISSQIENLAQQHQARLTQIDRQAILQRTQLERQAIQQTGQLWGQNIAKLITLQQGFKDTLRNLYFGMVQILSNALAQVIENWLTQHLTALLLGTAASKTSAAGQIVDNAAVAFSAAWASTAAIPIVGPELAPAAAGSAMAGAMGALGFLAVPGYDVGAWNLSKDQLAMVHTGEMIIPPGMADGMRTMMSMFAGAGQWQLPSQLGIPLRDMLSNPSNDNGAALSRATGTDGGDGDVHVHLNVTAMDSSGVRKVLLDNTHHLAEAVRKAKREHRFTNMKL